MKSALVTGAGGAIGGAIAEVLSSAGWHVIGVDLAFSPERQQGLDVAVACDITETARFRSPFNRTRANWTSSALDLDAMRDAAARLSLMRLGSYRRHRIPLRERR